MAKLSAQKASKAFSGKKYQGYRLKHSSLGRRILVAALTPNKSHGRKSHKAMRGKNPFVSIIKAGLRGSKGKQLGGLFMSSFPKI